MSQEEDYSTLALHLPSLSRPGLTSHHSSSLPSTPYQHSRKLNFNSRSPSPGKIPGNASPRSTHSESETGSRIVGRGIPSASGCKFEKGMAYSRRRIPYSEGGEQLERPSAMPKKYLNPAEEGKLSGDMRELYDRILPTKDSDSRRARFVRKLEHMLNEQWPGSDIKVHVFGSSGNMLCTTDSDVDICITTPVKALERVCHLAAALADHGMERVVCVNHAKVPIVKIWDPELELACDMNVNNTLALENTRMIKTYVEIDERVRPLAMIVKYWTKRRILNDAALGGTLSSYTWICMILSFLQTRNPPVLPCLQKRPHQRLLGPGGKPSAFADDLESLRGFGRKNKETLGELLFHFFRRYAYEIDYEKNVVSVREGQLISKEGKKWHLMQNNRLCVEEPFNIERNLGNTADDISFRGLHQEIRRAFSLVSDARLFECTEQYIFPAIEEKIWEKPPPKPPPVLTRSQSQSGRGGKGGPVTRGGRNGQSQNRNVQARRASSAATSGRYNAPQHPLRNQAGREHPLQAPYDRLQLHERFLSEYQLLQAQEQELRLLQLQAQLHAQAQAQAQATSPMAPFLQQTNGDNIGGRSSRMHPSAPLTAPVRHVPLFHPFAYPTIPNGPSPSIHTNPSSPSMKSAQLVPSEMRPRSHRSAAPESSSSASRSHSQPARSLPAGLPVSPLPPMPINVAALQQYQHLQQMRQQQLYTALEMGQRHRYVENHNPRPIIADQTYEDNLPKEYVGYYVHDSPPVRPHRDVPIIPQVPNYHDLFHRQRNPRSDPNRMRNLPPPLSPSQTTPFRDRSQSVRSAGSAPPSSVPMERVQTTVSASSQRRNGPIIVNGSDAWELHDDTTVANGSLRTSTASEATTSSEKSHDVPLPASTVSSKSQESYDVFGLDKSQRSSFHLPAPEVPRVSDITRHPRTEHAIRPANTHEINGKAYGAAPTDHSDHSKQVADGLGIRYDESSAKSTLTASEQHRQPPRVAPSQSNPPQSVDSRAEQASSRPDKGSKPAPLPLLSPVREVRSPSPTTAFRKRTGAADLNGMVRFTMPVELHIPPFSPEKHAQRQEKDALARKSAEKDAANFDQTAESVKASPQQPQINGWQQSTKNKKKRSKGHLSQISADMTTGEPLPSNEAERKGG
ncbi:MAG: hypothetical protein Q9190_007461 [Brigantiaea leucoxantha]